MGYLAVLLLLNFSCVAHFVICELY